MTTQIQERANLVERLQRFSSWHVAKRAVAISLRWKKKKTRTSQEEASTQAPELKFPFIIHFTNKIGDLISQHATASYIRIHE